jgi:hypothetical protein
MRCFKNNISLGVPNFQGFAYKLEKKMLHRVLAFTELFDRPLNKQKVGHKNSYQFERHTTTEVSLPSQRHAFNTLRWESRAAFIGKNKSALWQALIIRYLPELRGGLMLTPNTAFAPVHFSSEQFNFILQA